MHGQGQLYGHSLAFGMGYVGRASCQPVGHQRAHVDVVGIVVLAVLRAIDIVRRTRPLGIVAGTLEGARHAACGAASRDVAHAASEAHGIGGHHPVVFAHVGEHHAVELVVALVELERAEIDPRGIAHLLVDAESSGLAFVPHHIFGIGHAVGQGLIAHVDGIAACLRKRGLIGHRAGFLLLARGSHHAGRTGLKGILAIEIDALVAGKARLGSVAPVVAHSHLVIAVERGVVVVDDYLMALPVALARSEHDGACILEHRNEIGHDDGLGEEVLGRTKEKRALPLPETFLLVIVTSVAGPDRDVAVLQAM